MSDWNDTFTTDIRYGKDVEIDVVYAITDDVVELIAVWLMDEGTEEQILEKLDANMIDDLKRTCIMDREEFDPDLHAEDEDEDEI
jgi:hypothetical protein